MKAKKKAKRSSRPKWRGLSRKAKARARERVRRKALTILDAVLQPNELLDDMPMKAPERRLTPTPPSTRSLEEITQDIGRTAYPEAGPVRRVALPPTRWSRPTTEVPVRERALLEAIAEFVPILSCAEIENRGQEGGVIVRGVVETVIERFTSRGNTAAHAWIDSLHIEIDWLAWNHGKNHYVLDAVRRIATLLQSRRGAGDRTR